MRAIVIIGAGPSGLAAAYELSCAGIPVIVLETEEQVGGLARTIKFNGLRYDVGPHRFFTKSSAVLKLWQKVLNDELLTVKRLTHILHSDSLFDYPLSLSNTLAGLGIRESILIIQSYIWAQWHRLCHNYPENNFEDWVINHFGHRLYELFFKTYSEKVWGISCEQLEKEWADQRIKGLNLWSAVMNILFKNSNFKPKTLVDQFLYPRLGAGYFYERLAIAITAQGGQVITGQKCIVLRHENRNLRAIVAQDRQGQKYEIEAREVIASSPITETVKALNPCAPPEILNHAKKLLYRSHIAVNIVVNGTTFPDQWLYIHSNKLKMARISDYRNFSCAMTDSPDRGPLTVEYFAFPQDKLWRTSDQEIMALVKHELSHCRHFSSPHILDGFVLRHQHAYPLIRLGYKEHLEPVKHYLKGIKGLKLIGRGGLFRYNNQDHAIINGLQAASNILGGSHINWLANTRSEEYLEEGICQRSH
jgi:protoporphyrinogen oxidase